MSNVTRITKSFSVEKQLLQEVESTRGPVSTSERVNQLLRAGLEAERRESLHSEAAKFFRSVSPEERKNRRSFQAATIKSLARE